MRWPASCRWPLQGRIQLCSTHAGAGAFGNPHLAAAPALALARADDDAVNVLHFKVVRLELRVGQGLRRVGRGGRELARGWPPGGRQHASGQARVMQCDGVGMRAEGF
jgi:hypothetical protein